MGEHVARKRQTTASKVAEVMRGQGVLGDHGVCRQRLGGLMSFYHRRLAA